MCPRRKVDRTLTPAFCQAVRPGRTTKPLRSRPVPYQPLLACSCDAIVSSSLIPFSCVDTCSSAFIPGSCTV
ncbi:hypothetical protein IG631_10544 [Alternaria alternata]|nr:hypothetical protein IG631_10544 [Alternaria alternata]